MKTTPTTDTYKRKHIYFFTLMMLLMLIICGRATAQELQVTPKSSYLRFGVGYGLPSGSQMIGSNSTYTSSSTSYTSKEEGIYGTLGSGLVFNAGYTHLYSKNIGLDLNLQYLAGKKYVSNGSYSGNNTTSTTKSSIQSHGVLFSPAVVFTMGDNKVKPYVNMGVVMGTVKVKQEQNGASYNAETTFEGGFSFGFKGAFGIDAAISEKTIFFTELAFTSMSYYPKKAKMVATMNGITQEENMEFVKETSHTNGSQQYQELRDAIPMGSVALTMGLKFRL